MPELKSQLLQAAQAAGLTVASCDGGEDLLEAAVTARDGTLLTVIWKIVRYPRPAIVVRVQSGPDEGRYSERFGDTADEALSRLPQMVADYTPAVPNCWSRFLAWLKSWRS